MPQLEANLQSVRARITESAAAAGREPGDVLLVAVTKSVQPPVAARLPELGVRELGESRVGVLEEKATYFREQGIDARWHLIGHLQRNKARRAVRLADEIHSVDSERLLEALDRVAGEEDRRPGVWLEVKLVDLDTRTGFAPDALAGALAAAAALRNLRLLGLMTLAAPDPDARPGDAASQERARAVFARLVALGEGLAPELRAAFEAGAPRYSMGMSQDLDSAVEEGSHRVRVGSALFEGVGPTTGTEVAR